MEYNLRTKVYGVLSGLIIKEPREILIKFKIKYKTSRALAIKIFFTATNS